MRTLFIVKAQLWFLHGYNLNVMAKKLMKHTFAITV